MDFVLLVSRYVWLWLPGRGYIWVNVNAFAEEAARMQ